MSDQTRDSPEPVCPSGAAETEPQEPLQFEAALDQLEAIVAELEDGRLGLEASMLRFEQGVRLLRRCHAILGDAERKIEILTGFNAEGGAETAPFDAQATFDETASAGKRASRRNPGGRPSASGELEA